ncbi:MAG: NIPSNAP family protein, partial [Candidatus Limnocylindria bacterium]
NPGKMEALHARFRDHTNRLFVRHGITLIGFWSPLDAKEADQKMVYILAYPSKAAAEKSWQAFRTDPDWIAAKNASEKDGPLVAKVDSVFLKATDYSPMK